MRVVFFGSSGFSLPTLRMLAACKRHKLVGVAAQPDRPSGRHRTIKIGVVHEAADAAGFPVITPDNIGSPESLRVLESWKPDVIVVASFGQYIPTNVLRIPTCTTINVHPSLLPKYRGAAPLQWSVANGESVSGVTIFHVVREMDAGDIVLQEQQEIGADETAVALGERYAEIGARMALEAVDLMESGSVSGTPQNAAEATYAPKLTKADGAMDWRRDATELHNRIRGFQPWPGNYFVHGGEEIKVWRSRVESVGGRPGEIVDMDGEGPLVACGIGGLRLLELQPAGKKTMSGQAFLCGHRWMVGGILPPVVATVGKDQK